MKMSRPMNKAERAKHVSKMITGTDYEEITEYVMAWLDYHVFSTGADKSQDFNLSYIKSTWNWEHVLKHRYTDEEKGIDLNGYK